MSIEFLVPFALDTARLNLQENPVKHNDVVINIYSDLYPVRVVVQQQHTGAGHLLGFHHSFEISQ